MTDRNKFEQMLEHLINDESDKAKELFHQLVVEKSREIYEEILAEDFEEIDEKKEEDDEEVDEAAEDDEEQVDEAKDEEDDEEMDESFGFAEGDDEDEGDVGGDAGDDMIGDLEAGDDEGGEEGEGDLEDRVMDLEDALDELKSEFEQLMAGEEGGMDDMGGDDMDMDMGGADDDMELEQNFIREYTEKVSAKMGDDGVNNKSIVAGKNDMGGTAKNLVQGGEAKGEGTKGGLLNPSTKEENFGNVNVPGGKAGVKHLKKDSHGHGAEKKGSGDMGDKSAGSPINGAPNRAK